MTGIKTVFGAFVFLFLAAALFAQAAIQPNGMLGASDQNSLMSMVTVVPVDSAACTDPAQTCVLTATAFAFQPATSASGVSARDAMQQLYQDCKNDPYYANNLQGCLIQKSAERFGTVSGASTAIVPLPDAKIYFSSVNTVTGARTAIDAAGCPSPVTANIHTQATLPQSCDPLQPGCVPQKVDYYSAQCTIPTSLRTGSATTQIEVTYVGGDVIAGSTTLPAPSAGYTLNNPQPTAAAALTRSISDLIAGVSQTTTSGGTTPACVGVFLILGLLLASLYFSGKSPVSLLDISTPRLPAPKGVAAGGQILLPYGWSEMKATTKKKMASSAGALGASMRNLGFGKGTSDEETIHKSIGALAGKTGLNDKFNLLGKKLPYDYGPADHKNVAEILNKASAMGGREALMAATVKDYLMGQRTMKSLDAITGHTDIGVKSPLMTNVDKLLTRTGLNANRYAVLGGGITAGAASTVRTGQMMYRGVKKAATEAPVLGAAVAGTAMTMVSGRRLEDMARTSPTAAWISQKLAAHPNDLVIGTHYPIVDKMAKLYTTLHDETLHDEMRYVLKQLYKKAGMNFNIGESELVEMGYKDMDILKKCGYTGSGEMDALDASVRKILSTHTTDIQKKLQQLVELAESRSVFIDPQMRAMTSSLENIAKKTDTPDHLKLGLVQMALEEKHNYDKAAMKRAGADDAYVCHAGRNTPLTGSEKFETMVLRTMIWDAEHGHLNGGMREALTSARLNVVNRATGLDASSASALAQLPEFMRNQAELEKLAARNKTDLVSLFTEEGKREFQQVKGKTMGSASISEIVNFMYGGTTPKTGTVNGKMVWWGENTELGLRPEATLVDVKRHWVTSLEPRENFALGQWVESRFTKSYVPHFDAEIEAQLNRMSGSANWTVAQRTEEAKKLLLGKLVGQDMENRYNSQFAQNAYGTTHETLRFYEGQMAGVLRKVMQDKGIEPNHPDLRALETMDFGNPKSIDQFNRILGKYRSEVEAQLKKPITYDDVARSKQAMVMLHEGGLAYYHKGMMLSDMDRVLGGEVALKDNKGQLRKYNPDDVAIKLPEPLMRELAKIRGSNTKNKEDWENIIGRATAWKDENGYSYDRQKIFGALLWQYANATADYSRFWQQSAVSVESKRQVTPLAPSPMRFFGAEAPALTTMLKPWRDIGLHFGDYISKVSLAAGGPVHKAAYDIAPLSEYYRQHSFQLSSKILSGEALKGLSEEERVAYRAAAVDHFAYHQVWDYAIDRNPWRQSTSFGAHQAWGSFFHFGPGAVFDIKSNVGASMDRGQYANFMTFYGFPMDLAGKIMRPYTSMIRGMQMSMQGYASKWDATGDALKQWNYTQPRMMEAMQSLNPFSFKWFPGKTSERLQKLNVYGGSLEKHQLAGSDFMLGLRQAPQDIYLNRKGVYATARTGEANPGVSHYNYRHELTPEASVGEYLFRQTEGAFIHDKRVEESALTNTVRRTVSAEALAIRRDQELRSFGIMQNPLYGWASPVAALWHMPIPGTPSFLTPKDWVSNAVRKSKTGEQGTSFAQRLQSVAESTGKFLTKVAQPGQLSRVVYCPRCGMANYRGSNCKNPSCRQAQY